MKIEKSETRNYLSANAKEWLRVFVIVGIVVAFILMATQVYASDGTEFQEATDKFEGWIKGNLGKLAALIALAVGAIVAAVRKDWTWFLGAVVLSMGMGILLGIVNSSFTATI